MQHGSDLISARYKLQIMRGRGIQNGKINWFVLNLMDKEILQLAMTQIDENQNIWLLVTTIHDFL